MKKLHQLKSWLTLEDTAKRLSMMLNDDVTVADVLQLVLEGHLTLSVNFVDEVYGKIGKVVSIENATIEKFSYHPLLREFGLFDYCQSVFLFSGMQIANDENKLLELNETSQIMELSGIFDLPMIGAEKYAVRDYFQSLIPNGVKNTCNGIFNGFFVTSLDGKIYQLQVRHNEPVNINSSLEFQNEAIRRYKECIQSETDLDAETEALAKKTYRGTFLHPRNYYPASEFPDTMHYAVRTSAINKFEQSLLEQPVEKLKYTHTSELMQIMDEAIIEFWENHDPKNPPKREVIKLWIKENNENLSDREIRRCSKFVDDI